MVYSPWVLPTEEWTLTQGEFVAPAGSGSARIWVGSKRSYVGFPRFALHSTWQAPFSLSDDVFVVPGQAPGIPALSRGAMAVLSVSMGLLGLYWIRRLRLA